MKSVVLSVFVFCALVCLFTAANAEPIGDFSLQQRQTIATLANYIAKIANSNDYTDYLPAEKRNAEVLNSLIGLPRLLKDKGR